MENVDIDSNKPVIFHTHLPAEYADIPSELDILQYLFYKCIILVLKGPNMITVLEKKMVTL